MMLFKHRLLSTALLGGLLIGCASNSPSSQHQPAYTTPCQSAMLQALPNGVLKAKGEGASQAEALRIALANIAVQMQVSIQSNSESQQSKKGNQSQQQYLRNIRSSSQHVFTDYNVLCKSKHDVVVSFDNRPLTQRVQSLLEEHYEFGWELKGPNWLRNSPALNRISDKNSGESVSLKLFKLDQFWYLSLNQQQLKLRTNEWRFLYALPNSNLNTKKIQSEIWLSNEYNQRLPTKLNNGDEFRINISHNIHFNFFSLLYIQNDGSVYPVRLNQPLNQTQVPRAPGIFSAEAESELSVDDYIIILSNKVIAPPASKQNLGPWLDITEKEVSLGLRVYVKG